MVNVRNAQVMTGSPYPLTGQLSEHAAAAYPRLVNVLGGAKLMTWACWLGGDPPAVLPFKSTRFPETSNVKSVPGVESVEKPTLSNG